MRRVFNLDVLACPRCGGRLRVIAAVQDPLAVQAILAHLPRSGAPAPPPAPPAPAPSRSPRLSPSLDAAPAPGGAPGPAAAPLLFGAARRGMRSGPPRCGVSHRPR